MYNYNEAVRNDLMEMVRENIETYRNMSRNRLEEKISDDALMDDSVTGNASGSYTFNTYTAEENLCHNMDLLEEALKNMGYDLSYLKMAAETCDVLIRCYLVDQYVEEAAELVEELTEEEETE